MAKGFGIVDGFQKLFRRRGRPSQIPQRDSRPYPNLFQLGGIRWGDKRSVPKPTPRNIRYFSKTPIARRAVNAIKNPVSMLEWEIAPRQGVVMNAEIAKQIEVVTACFDRPNNDDSFRTLVEQLVEDMMCGAGAVEIQPSGDPLRPIWLWPVDGLTIQIYPAWSGKPSEVRYAQVLGFGTYTGGAQRIDLRNDELIYVRPNPNSSTPFGAGPLEIAFQDIANFLATGEFTANVASNQHPSIMIDLGDIQEDALGAFRSYWRNEVEGQGQIPIVGMGGAPGDHRSRGIEVQRLHPEGDNAMFLKYREFQIRIIAAAFDLSPQNLSVERDVNRNTAETSFDRDWDHAIKPTAALVASHLTREAVHGLLGFSQIEFKFKGIDREDEQAASDIVGKLYNNNMLTPNEARERMGLPRREDQWSDLIKQDHDLAKLMAPTGSTLDLALEQQKKLYGPLFAPPPEQPQASAAPAPSAPAPDEGGEANPQKPARGRNGAEPEED